LRGLVKEGLDIVGVEIFREFAKCLVIRLVFLPQGGGARLIFSTGFRRIGEGRERLLRQTQLLARVLHDVGGLGPAAHHPGTGA